MKKLTLIFLVLSHFSCLNQSKDETQEVRSQVNKFYQWYVNSIHSKSYFALIKPTKGKDGKSKLDMEKYINKITELNVFHLEFINEERARLKKCGDLFLETDWKKIMDEEVSYDLDNKACDFLNYFYWIGSQEPIDGVDIIDVEQLEQKYIVLTNFYQVSENEKHMWDLGARIVLEEVNGQFKIRQIEIK